MALRATHCKEHLPTANHATTADEVVMDEKWDVSYISVNKGCLSHQQWQPRIPPV